MRNNQVSVMGMGRRHCQLQLRSENSKFPTANDGTAGATTVTRSHQFMTAFRRLPTATISSTVVATFTATSTSLCIAFTRYHHVE